MRTILRSVAAAAVPAVLLVPLALAPAASADEPEWTSLTSADEPEVNPLKGFIPFAGDYDTFPYSMEWSYFPLNAVMTGADTFDWTALDTALDEIASRGHQTALRFYLDYPTKASGIPQYLIDDGLVTHTYDDYGNNGVSVSPDYDDPELRAAIASFVSALGDRYDGDPRIGYLQAGLVGFWGEWHTYPYNGDASAENWMPSETTQAEIVGEFVDAFSTTQLEVRNPTSVNADLAIGYHDDSFALETMQSSLGWHFVDNLIATGTQDKWQEYSIGGELRPELQSCLFSAAGCPVLEEGGDNDFAGSVAQTHATWLIDHYAFETGYTGTDYDTALAAATSLGYSFRVTQALVSPDASSGTVTVGMDIANIGVAPFYYDWPITIAFVDQSGSIVATQTTDWHVSDIASGSSAQLTVDVDASSLPTGELQVVAQVTNPLTGGIPVRFANADQDADVDGWLTLGSTTVAATGTTTTTAVSADGTGEPAASGSQSAVLAATGADAGRVAAVACLALVLAACGVALTTSARARRR
ncbi:MAG TPA: DUF4832 domain-containing protein [Cellulomonas sp.]